MYTVYTCINTQLFLYSLSIYINTHYYLKIIIILQPKPMFLIIKIKKHNLFSNTYAYLVGLFVCFY